MPIKLKDLQDITNRVVVVTGAAGLLGRMHCEAIAELGGIPVLLDINIESLEFTSQSLTKTYGVRAPFYVVDITNEESVNIALSKILSDFKQIDALINNAAFNPKMSGNTSDKLSAGRVESFSMDQWDQELNVGLKGSFICSKYFGMGMAEQKSGSIINIASDLGLIGPDQRIYQRAGLAESEQPVKPVTYSVVKGGLVAMTKYFATYWAHRNVRVNCICPGGIYVDQESTFVEKLSSLIPLGRMAHQHEYKGIVAYLISDASSYMTGSIIPIEGGRTAW